MSISLKMFFIYNVLCCVSFTFLCSILYLVKVKLIKDLCAQLRAGVRDKFLSTIEFSYKYLVKLIFTPLTGSLSLSGMLSMDIRDPGLDRDSRSSLDLRSVS